MTVSFSCSGLNFTVASVPGNRICYILLPECPDDICLKFIDRVSERCRCSVATVSGIDWNNDLTPWTADGVFAKSPSFGGKAEDFLERLGSVCFPYVEGLLSGDCVERYIAGVSLSGLFAVWSMWKCDLFKGIASVSGSFWYDGFLSWASSNTPVGHPDRIFISLGDREGKTANRRLATVSRATGDLCGHLSGLGFHVDFRLVEGTHFSPLIPRLELALESVLE